MTLRNEGQRRSPKFLGFACLAACIGGLLSTASLSADWLTYRGDAARTGFTPFSVGGEVTQVWSIHPGVPEPAWPRSGRMSFDRAFQPVIAGGFVFFGHSADHGLYRLDLASGRGETIYVADGPIRFAPAVWQDRLLVVSDDGFLACLDFDGQVHWKHRGGLDGSMRLGNEQLVSKWPARGAPVVVGDIVYYAAGIWPTDEIFIHALEIADGRLVWTNDDSGGIYMPQPHGGADAESGVSAQGYLVVSGTAAAESLFPGAADRGDPDGDGEPDGDGGAESSGDGQPEAASPRLLLPTGRAVPASFDLDSGAFEYFHLQQYGQRGGFATMALGPMFFNSGIAFDVASGRQTESFGEGPIVAVPGGLVRSTRGQVIGYRWVRQTKTDRRGNASEGWGLEPRWTADGVDGGNALIAADRTVVAGGDGSVTLLDRETGEVLGRHAVDGVVYGLAATEGWLVASTDRGNLIGFRDATRKQDASDAEPTGDGLAGEGPAVDGPAGDGARAEASGPASWPRTPAYAAAAGRIVEASDVRRGYCLDLGCGDGELARELAERTELRIYAVDDDVEAVRRARRRLRAAGLYGTRVTVHHVDDLTRLPHPRYFANLIVSGRSVIGEPPPPLAADDVADHRCLRPYGGVVCVGGGDSFRTFVRGELRGAGQWTHQYASAANQLSSADTLVQGPLGMLWYRDVDIDVPQRHGRPPAPLFFQGLLYHQGIDELVCVDAYNGLVVWRYGLPGILKAYDGDELMGVSGTGSNFCIGEDGVYVRRDDHCLRLDRRTGELLGKFAAPPQADGGASTWGYIAVEGRHLIGSLADRGHQVTFRYRATTGDMSEQLTESRTLFVMDATTGELRWRYDAEDSIRHNAIAVEPGRVYLIDRPQATFDRAKDGKPDRHPPGVLVALDAESGDVLWRNRDEVDGTMLAVSPEHGRLLMSYQPTRFALASEVGGKLTVFDTADGEPTWKKDAKYASRPLINDYTVYAQGGAWDLLTGEEQPFDFSRSYGCGVLAASRHMMVYRSATLGYYDLLEPEGTQNYGGMRPGCWINAIPAGGLVLVPDASAGCVCSYLNQSWMALEPLGVATPRVEPDGGAFAEPVSVRLDHPDRDGVIRYTLDGSTPTATSEVYREPLVLDESAQVRARYFADDGRLSRAVDRRFTIDPDLLPLGDESWRVWDVPGQPSGGPSDWSVDAAGVVTQRSNIFLGSATDSDPETPRYGTLRIFDGETAGGAISGDGVIDVEIRSADDDGIGLAFRFADPRHHYLWAADLQRRFRILAVKDGDDYRVLAKNGESYAKNRWFSLRVVLEGDRIRVFVDGEPEFDVRDERFAEGTIALYSWGSENVQFRNLRFRPGL